MNNSIFQLLIELMIGLQVGARINAVRMCAAGYLRRSRIRRCLVSPTDVSPFPLSSFLIRGLSSTVIRPPVSANHGKSSSYQSSNEHTYQMPRFLSLQSSSAALQRTCPILKLSFTHKRRNEVLVFRGTNLQDRKLNNRIISNRTPIRI